MKTDNWAIAVTSGSETVENISFTISSVAKAKVWGKWSRHSSFARCGPYMSECCHELFSFSGSKFLILLVNNNNTTANQTLFINRIALRSDVPLGKKTWGPSIAPRSFIQRLWATLDPDDSWIFVSGWIIVNPLLFCRGCVRRSIIWMWNMTLRAMTVNELFSGMTQEISWNMLCFRRPRPIRTSRLYRSGAFILLPYLSNLITSICKQVQRHLRAPTRLARDYFQMIEKKE